MSMTIIPDEEPYPFARLIQLEGSELPAGWIAVRAQTPLATKPNLEVWATALGKWIARHFKGQWRAYAFLDDPWCIVQCEVGADADRLKSECAKHPRGCIPLAYLI